MSLCAILLMAITAARLVSVAVGIAGVAGIALVEWFYELETNA